MLTFIADNMSETKVQQFPHAHATRSLETAASFCFVLCWMSRHNNINFNFLFCFCIEIELREYYLSEVEPNQKVVLIIISSYSLKLNYRFGYYYSGGFQISGLHEICTLNQNCIDFFSSRPCFWHNYFSNFIIVCF